MISLKAFAIAVAMAGAVGASADDAAFATLDQTTMLAVPHWVNETIYRPDCPRSELGRALHPGSSCHEIGHPQR
jgi:hypothetical protein